MLIDATYTLMLIVSLTMMASIAFLQPKRIEHLLFAAFCGSLAMTAIQWHSADVVGPYRYLIAFGTSATCNILWLLSIALFGAQGRLTLFHYLFAATISVLVVMNYSIDLVISLQWIDASAIQWLERSAGELTTLFSSTVLMLTLWETSKGFRSCSRTQKIQRLVFASGFFVAVFNCIVVARAFVPEPMQAQVFPWFVVSSALIILSATFAVIIWQYVDRKSAPPKPAMSKPLQPEPDIADPSVFFEVERLMQQEQLFLQADLKMLDVAQTLRVPEYKISAAIRAYSSSPNFNQFVNAYRVAHARRLLTSPATKNTTILAISLDSGFASIAPFNRAFKGLEGCTPKEYRKRCADENPQPLSASIPIED